MPPPPRPPRGPLGRLPLVLVLAGLLAWSAFAFLAELQEAVAGFDRRDTERSDAIRWRFGTRPVEILQQCLAEARLAIPPGDAVVFVSPVDGGRSDFYRWRWAAYLLPENPVLRPTDARAAETARWVVAHRQPFEHPRAVLARRLTGCVLYRVTPPPPTSEAPSR